MKALCKTRAILIVLVFSISLLTGCGGGGSGSGGDGEKAINYTGKDTAAVIDKENAAEISIGSYENGTSTDGMAVFTVETTSMESESTTPPRTVLLAETLKEAFLAAEPTSIEGSLNIRSTSTTTYEGVYSGQMTLTQSSETSGTILFSNYSDDGATFLDGSVSFSLTLDAYQELESFTMTFSDLSATISDAEFTYNGSITFNFGTSVDSFSLTMVVKDDISNTTYKLQNFEVAIDSANGTIDIGGKFYDPDYGYVTLSTPAPLTTSDAGSWPSGGTFHCAGDESWVELEFTPTVANGSADTNGDNVADTYFTYDPQAAPGEEITYLP